MTQQMWLTFGLFIIGISFNAGGFVWLAFNHFRHQGADLARLQSEVSEIKADVAFIKGKLE